MLLSVCTECLLYKYIAMNTSEFMNFFEIILITTIEKIYKEKPTEVDLLHTVNSGYIKKHDKNKRPIKHIA